MHFTTSTTGLVLGLMSVWSCVAAPAEQIICPKIACHTYTAFTTPAVCPKLKCPAPTGLVCPMYISVTTSKVPCHTDCCPKTGTRTITKPCSTCPTGCVIPTETITMTTGCKGKTTLPPMITTAPGGSVTLMPGGGGATVTLKPGKL